MVTETGRRGFTLLELLVVLAVIGLILTIAPPLFLGAGGGTEVEAKARELAAALRLTRSEAITRNRVLAVALDVEARQFSTVEPKPGVFPEDLDISLRLAPDGRESPGGPARGGRILFFPDGSSTGGTISLARESRGYDIQVDWLTGHVSIDDRPRAAP